ncbi:MAG: hypothetical protein WDZ93_02225 [Candidatus Paceibacterota bacterium]
MFIELWILCSFIAFGAVVYAALRDEMFRNAGVVAKVCVVVGATLLGPLTIGVIFADIADRRKGE